MEQAVIAENLGMGSTRKELDLGCAAEHKEKLNISSMASLTGEKNRELVSHVRKTKWQIV